MLMLVLMSNNSECIYWRQKYTFTMVGLRSCVLLLPLLCKLESIIIVDDGITKRFAWRHIRRRQASTRCWASPYHNPLAATWPTILLREIRLRVEEEKSYLETTGTRSREQYSTAANLSSWLPVATAWFEIFVGCARISEVFQRD